MFRAKVYPLGIGTADKIKLQGETEEIDDEALLKWPETRQRLIDDWVRFQESINVNIKGKKPIGVQKQGWRRKISNQIEIIPPDFTPKQLFETLKKASKDSKRTINITKTKKRIYSIGILDHKRPRAIVREKNGKFAKGNHTRMVIAKLKEKIASLR